VLPPGPSYEGAALFASPPFASFTVVYAKYCSGDSWTADNATVATVSGASVYFRGRRLLDALLADLMPRGLIEAPVVLVAGCSAGALTAYTHVDFIASTLPPATIVLGLADAMFALEHTAFPGPNTTTYATGMFEFVASNWNTTGAPVNAPCLAHFGAADRVHCMWGATAARFVATPTMIVNSKYDTWQEVSIVGLNTTDCPATVSPAGVITLCTPAHADMEAFWVAYGDVLTGALAQLPPRFGAFITNCPVHCETGVSWDNPSTGTVATLGEAVAAWYAAAVVHSRDPSWVAPRFIANDEDGCVVATRGARTAQISFAATPAYVVPPTFLSYNLDPSCNRGFHRTNFSNPNLAAAGRFLEPSRLRFGGSGAESLVYGLTPGAPECASVPTPPSPLQPGCDYGTVGCLNSSMLDDLFSFAAAARADFIFGVAYDDADACAGRPFNTTNIENLLASLAPTQSTGRHIFGAELGNEANLNKCVTPARLAADATTFAALLEQALPGTVLIGPDTGQLYGPTQWAAEFAGNMTPGALFAVTNHWYLNLARADFASAATLAAALDSQVADVADFAAMVRATAPGAEAHAGEVGPHGGGDDGSCGPNSTCGVFASAIWYADDVGLRSAAGISQHNRQTLFGGAYGLTQSIDGVMELSATAPLAVTPDYWLAWLMKRTLGPSVYAAASSDASVRAYVFSGSAPSPFAARAHCSAAGKQLLLINLATAPATAALPSAAPGAGYAAWSLTPVGGDPFAAAAELNGARLPTVLDVVNGGDPAAAFGDIAVPPVTGAAAAGVALPPMSISVVCLGA
jgi:hypothetical protein